MKEVKRSEKTFQIGANMGLDMESPKISANVIYLI